MADRQTVVVALAMLRSHYPGEHPAIDEATVVAWHGAGLAGLPDDAVLTAAADWDTGAHDRFPSSGVFLRECQRTARSAFDAARAAAQQTGEGTPTEIVGGFRLPVKSALDRAYVRAIRAALEARAAGGSYLDTLNAVLLEHGVQPASRQDPLL